MRDFVLARQKNGCSDCNPTFKAIGIVDAFHFLRMKWYPIYFQGKVDHKPGQAAVGVQLWLMSHDHMLSLLD